MNQEQAAQMAQAMHEMQARQAQLETLLTEARATADAAARAAATSAVPGVGLQTVDTRLLGRPGDFNGEADRWRDWSVVFKGYAMAALPQLAELMRWALQQAAPAHNAALQHALQVQASQQLYWMLLMLCKNAALHVVLGGGDGEGLEAWRLLHERYEPSVPTRFAAQLMALMSVNLQGELTERMAAWERDVALYEAASGKNLDDEVRIGIFMLRLPESPTKTHLLMRSDHLRTWKDFRSEILAITRAIESKIRTIRIPVYKLEMINRVRQSQRALYQSLGREPTLDEISAQVDIEPEKIEGLMRLNKEPMSLDAPRADDPTSTIGDFIENPDAVLPNESLEARSLAGEIPEVLGTLTPREEKVIRMRYGIGEPTTYSLEQVGSEFNLTRERIRQIEIKALRKLRRAARRRGLAEERVA